MDAGSNKSFKVIYSEEGIMRDLQSESVVLIRHTTAIPAIKKVVEAHDIVSLNLGVMQIYSTINEPIWDLGSLQELSKIRRELLIYHKLDFDPEQKLELYGKKMAQLFRLVSLRIPNFRYSF